MNKRRVFGIITVIVIGLLAFAFANPNDNTDNNDSVMSTEELTTAKDKAIKDLESYVSEANYSVANWDLIEQIIIDGTDAINDATNQEEIDKALEDAKLLIDKIDTLAVELGAAKANAIKELNNYVLQANYSVNNWVLVQAEITKGVAAINASTTIENVALELTRAKTAIDVISTLEEDLAAAKTTAINELNNYVLEEDYSESNWILVQAEITKGIAAINASTTLENVALELANAKTLIDVISTLEEDLAAAKKAAIDVIKTYISDISLYRSAEQTEISNIIDNGIIDINKLELIESISPLVEIIKSNLDKVKTDAVLLAEELVEAKIAAINELETYIKDLTLYYDNEQTAIEKIIEDGIIDINLITDIKNVGPKLDELKTALDLVSTKVEVDAKNQASLDLDNYNNGVYYFDETKIEVNNLKTIGKVNINKADGLDAIEVALTEAKKTIDDLTTIYTVTIKDRNKVVRELKVENGIETSKLPIPEVGDKTYIEKNITFKAVSWNAPATITSNTTINLVYDVTKIVATIYVAKPADSIYNVLVAGGFTNKLNNYNYYKITTIELNVTDELKNIILKNKKVPSITSTEIEKYIIENLPVLNLTSIDNSEYYKYVWNVLKFENGDGFHIDGSIIFDQVQYDYDNELKEITATTSKTTFEISKTTTENIKDYLVVNAIDNKNRSKTVTNYDVTGFDTTSLGDKTLTISYTDNSITKTYTVNYSVVDTVSPAVTLNGSNNIVLTRKLGWSGYYVDYNEEGVTAEDLTATTTSSVIEFYKPYSAEKTIVNSIGGEIGTYEITYTAKDIKLNTTTITRTVKVKRSYDSSADILFSNVSNSKLEVCKNCSFVDDKNVTASDLFDGIWLNAQTLNVTADYSTVDMTKLGTYTVTYTATDWLGASKTVSREVKVVDTTDPVITLNGKTRTIVVEGTSVTIPDVTTTDNYDQNLGEIKYTVRTYWWWGKTYLASVTYYVSDSSGNKAELIIDIKPDVIVKK